MSKYADVSGVSFTDEDMEQWAKQAESEAGYTGKHRGPSVPGRPISVGTDSGVLVSSSSGYDTSSETAEQLNNDAQKRLVEDQRRQAAVKLVELSQRLVGKGDGRGWTREELWD